MIQQKFEEAIKSTLYKDICAVTLASEKCEAIHKEECIKFAEFCGKYIYIKSNSLWIQPDSDNQYTTSELYDLFNEDKTIKL